MKILAYDKTDHEFHEIKDTDHFRISMDNGDAYDLKENGDELKIRVVGIRRHCSVLPFGHDTICLKSVLDK